MTTVASPLHTLDRKTLLIAPSTLVVACLGTVYGVHNWTQVTILLPLLLVAVALVYGVVVQKARRNGSQAGWALGLGVAAVVLTLPAFWSGLPLVLGAAAALLGNEGRNRPRAGGRAIVGLALGVVAVLGYLAIYAGDVLVMGNAGFLFD